MFYGPGALPIGWGDVPVMRHMFEFFDYCGITRDMLTCFVVLSSRWYIYGIPGVEVQANSSIIKIGHHSKPQRLCCDYVGAEPNVYKTSEYALFGSPQVL